MASLLSVDDPRVQAAVARMRCMGCGSSRAEGLVPIRARWVTRDVVLISTRCLACGSYGQWSAAIDPDPTPQPISGEEVLDAFEALQEEDWWASLTGRQP